MITKKVNQPILEAIQEITYQLSVGMLTDEEAAEQIYEIYDRQMSFVLYTAKGSGLDLDFLEEN